MFEKQTVAVMAVYASSADVRIDDTVYEGAQVGISSPSVQAQRVSGDCVSIKDRYPPDSQKAESFTLCSGASVTR